MSRLNLIKKVISRYEFYPIFQELDQDFKRSTYMDYINAYKRKNTVASISELSSIKNTLDKDINTTNQQWLDLIDDHIGYSSFIDDSDLDVSINAKLLEIASQERISEMTQPAIMHFDFFYNTGREVPIAAIKTIELIEIQLLARFYGVLLGEIPKYFMVTFSHEQLILIKHTMEMHNRIVNREYHLIVISMILDHYFSRGKEPILSFFDFNTKNHQAEIKRNPGRPAKTQYNDNILKSEVKELLESEKFYHQTGSNKGLPNINSLVKKLERTTFQNVENPISSRHLWTKVNEVVTELINLK